MPNQNVSDDTEFAAMQTIYNTLESLDDEARYRVIQYVTARLQISGLASTHHALDPSTSYDNSERDFPKTNTSVSKYGSLAELVDVTQPGTNAEKALVAGYWLQICQGGENFDGFSANKDLKNLGVGIANITNAIDALRNQKPSLTLLLKKSGKSQQARKTYKLTVAGIKAVEDMIQRHAL